LDALPPDGLAVLCADTPAGRWLAGQGRGGKVTYGLDAGAAYTARIQEMVGRRSIFEARRGDDTLGLVTLAIPGAYNVQNALGALAVTLELGVPFAAAAEALREFRGVLRRFTVRGEIGGILVVDDYAHNPTKVKALLQAARDCWPRARIIAVFQPHRYSRTRTVGGQFAEAFDPADEVIITELYAADEPAIPGVDSGIIVRAVAARRSVRFIAEAGEVVDALERHVRPGDLVLTIGAGDVGKIGDALVSRLRAGRAAMPEDPRRE
jgi:UDP-N-acetylmuramate--alanine ligase